MPVRVCKCTSDTIKVGDNRVLTENHKCTLKLSTSTQHLELRHSFVVLIKCGVNVKNYSYLETD